MARSKLSKKLNIVVVPLVLIPVITLGIFSLYSLYENSDNKIQYDLHNQLTHQSYEIQNELNIYSQVVSLLAKNQNLEQILGTQKRHRFNTDNINEIINSFVTVTDVYQQIASIELVDKQGELHAFHSKNLLANSRFHELTNQLNYTPIEYAQIILTINEPNSVRAHFVQQILLPTSDNQQLELWGFLVVSLHEKVLASSEVEYPLSSTIMIINDKGKVLTSSVERLIDEILVPIEYQQLTELESTSNSQYLLIRTLNNTKQWFHSKLLQDQSLLVIFTPDNQWNFFMQPLFLVVFISVILCATLVPWLIYRTVKHLLLEPVEQLTYASYEIGEGNFDIQLAVTREDEFGRLFTDFNMMVSKLNQTNHELKDYQTHLADKVVQRTSALREANTQLELAIKEAQKANELKSRFLANMSHEIRTPLTAIIGFTEQALVNDLEASERNNYLQTVLRNSSHLLELISNVLDLSKIEADKLELESVELSLFEVINDINAIVTPQAHAKGLLFTLKYRFPLPTKIYSDQTRLKQILLNICSNAVKFTSHGEIEITINFDQAANILMFSIKDTGIGMSDEEQQRIFKPFEQADTSTTRRFGGTGLGLCISKNLAQLLGGDISVSSRPNFGSEFVFTLYCISAGDLIQSDADLPQQEHYGFSEINQEYLGETTLEQHYQGRILLAEDNEDNQKLISLLLKRKGIHTTVVSNGKLAVEKVLAETFDLILMDMQMPIMGGQEATQLIRYSGIEIPILALTANVMKADIEAYKEVGCNNSIAKPIDTKTFYQQIEKYLSQSNTSEADTIEVSLEQEIDKLGKGFLHNLVSQLQQLQQAHQELHNDKIAKLAHSIKGSGGCFGFDKVTELAALLETEARQGLITNSSTSYIDFIDYCVHLIESHHIEINL